MTTEGTDAPATGTEGTEEPAEEPTVEQPPEPAEGDGTDWKAEAEKYKALSRKHETRAKANAKAASELEQVKASQLSEQEKAVEAARREGVDIGNKALVRAEVIAAAAGKAADPSDVYALLLAQNRLADIEVSEGNVDTEAVTAAVDALLAEKKHLTAGVVSRDPDFGARPPAVPAQNPDAAMDNWLRHEYRR